MGTKRKGFSENVLGCTQFNFRHTSKSFSVVPRNIVKGSEIAKVLEQAKKKKVKGW